MNKSKQRKFVLHDKNDHTNFEPYSDNFNTIEVSAMKFQQKEKLNTKDTE